MQVQIPLRDPVVMNPKILGGIPVVKGTRIPASLVFELLKRGYPLDLIVREYPSLSKKKVESLIGLVSDRFNGSSA
jgi:uncharacterized protein (DUF433 family)